MVVPTAAMDTLQVTVLVLVAAGATIVVRTTNRTRLVLTLSVYGMLLAILFLVFQAPDVALSELTVGAIALPLILLLAISKVSRPNEREKRAGADKPPDWEKPPDRGHQAEQEKQARQAEQGKSADRVP